MAKPNRPVVGGQSTSKPTREGDRSGSRPEYKEAGRTTGDNGNTFSAYGVGERIRIRKRMNEEAAYRAGD